MARRSSLLWRLGLLCAMLGVCFACRIGATESVDSGRFREPTAVKVPGLRPTAAPRPTAQSVTPTVSALQPRPALQSQHERIFRYVWTTVERSYVYPDYNGVDWSAARKAFTPRVAAAPDDETFWWLMQDLIDQLSDEHSVFLSPSEVAEEDQALQGDLDYVGIGVYVTLAADEDYGVVLFPLPGSPAEDAGLRSHERILAIDGKPVCCTADGSDRLDLMLGEPETQVKLEVQYPGEPVRHVEVTRRRIQTQIPVVTRRLSMGDHVAGYILIPTLWDETIAERGREAVSAFLAEPAEPVDGLVLDLRINGGGAYTELYDLLSLFVSGEVGTFYRRGGRSEALVIEPDPVANSLTVPLVVLTGRETASFAEVMAGVLQDVGRAHVVGQPTLGNLETVYGYDLEDGSRLWLAEEVFESRSGVRWEGSGVVPDVEVPGDWADFTIDDDPQLEAALDLMLEVD